MRLFKLTTDLEGVESGLVGNESVELLLGQIDDLGHLIEDLLCVGIAWGDTIVFLNTLVDGGGDGVGFATKLDGIAIAHLLALLGNLVGLGDLALEVIEVLEDLLEVARHFDGGCWKKRLSGLFWMKDWSDEEVIEDVDDLS